MTQQTDGAMKKSKYYYEFTRNLTEKQKMQTYCGRPACIDVDDCECISESKEFFKEVDNKKWTSNHTYPKDFSYT